MRIHKLESLTYHGPPKPRRLIAIDETKTKLNGEWLYIWAAIDMDTKEILAEISLNAYIFLQRILKVYSIKAYDIHGL
jgi:transposase-like protein